MTSRAGVMGMGGRYKDEGGMEGEAGGRVRPATVASRVLCLRRWGPSKKRGGSDGEEEVGRCERGGTCHNDKPGLRGGND